MACSGPFASLQSGRPSRPLTPENSKRLGKKGKKEDTPSQRNDSESRKENPLMNDTVSRQGKASPGFVEQVESYLRTCWKRIQAQEEQQEAGPDAKRVGRPLELPKV